MKQLPFIVMYILENGATLKKLGVSFMLSLMASPVFYFMNKLRLFLFPDLDYVVWISIAITVDWISGMAKHFKQKEFDHEQMLYGLCVKVGVCFGALLLFNGIGSTLVKHPDIAAYLMLIGKMAIFIYVSISANNNFFFLSGGKFPPVWYMNRMKYFNSTGSIDDLLKNENQKK